jgi:hypothetical protein
MRNNKTDLPYRNGHRFMNYDVLTERIKLIQSFGALEEDEDLMPVAQQEIDCAIDVMKDVYAKKQLLPFAVVPTRSGGVALEYRIDGAKANYRFDNDGSMHFSAIKERMLLKQATFASVVEAPSLLDIF